MRKLIGILTVVVFVIAFTVPALAGEKVKITGEFDYSAITPFDAAKAANGFGNYYFDITLPVDDYNEVLIEFWGPADNDVEGAGSQGGAGRLGYFQLTTDVGKALDLPVGLKTKAGITSVYSRKFEVTGHALERPVRPYVDPVGLVAAFDFGPATLDVGLGFGQGQLEANNDIGFLLGVPEVGPASLEVYYMANNNADMKGIFGANVKATDLLDGMLGVAGMFAYDTVTEGWWWGLGASVKYNIVTLGVSVNGNDVDALNVLGIDLDAALTDTFGATVATKLDFSEAAEETFQGIDISGYVKVGGATWRVGYIFTDYGYAYGSNVAAPEGGIYFSAGIDF
jgi:hypothetical protein